MATYLIEMTFETALQLKDEYPTWDNETLIEETMDCMQLSWWDVEREETENELREFIETGNINNTKNPIDENK